MRVMLVYPNVSVALTPQMGLLSIGSFLDSKGIEVKICDLTFTSLSQYEDVFLSEIEKWNPDVIGISCRTMEYVVVANLCKSAKKMYPDKILVA